MPTSLTSSNLTVRVQDSISINGKSYGGSFSKTYSGITHVFNRIIPVPSTAETVLYTGHASTVTGSQFDWDLVKYARITNKDTTFGCDIMIQNDDNDEVCYTIEPNESVLIFNHKTNFNVAHATGLSAVTSVVAATTLAVGDGDAANGMTEGQYVQLISTDGTTKNYVMSDTNAGGVGTGTELASDSDIGSNTFANLTSAVTAGVAVGINKSSATQNAVLVQLKAAIESTNGHDGKIVCGSVPVEANGSQNFTITQSAHGADGNTVTTTDITNLTSADFSSGVTGEYSGKNSVKSVTALANNESCVLELFIASAS